MMLGCHSFTDVKSQPKAARNVDTSVAGHLTEGASHQAYSMIKAWLVPGDISLDRWRCFYP